MLDDRLYEVQKRKVLATGLDTFPLFSAKEIPVLVSFGNYVLLTDVIYTFLV